MGKRTIITIAVSIGIITALLGLNWIIDRDIDGYAQTVILQAGIFVILAVSLNLVNGFTGQFSLGQAGFYGIGAYVAAALTTYGQLNIFKSWFNDGSISMWAGGLLLVIAMLIAGIAAALAGFIVGLPSLKLRGDYLAIVTLGLNQIIVIIINNINQVGGAKGFGTIYPANTTPISIPPLASFFWVYLMAAIVIVVSINIRYSVHGLAFMSIREDEVAAEAMGIPTTKYKIIAFVLSAFFAGVAGALYAHTQCFISPTEFDFTISINIVVMVVLGGMGSVSGTAIGALLLAFLPEVLRGSSGQYRLVIYALMLIVLMLVRPRGIFGHEEISVAWFRGQANGVKNLLSRTRRLLSRSKRNSPDINDSQA
jgi:branched-chain amino acid transport system permease protein